jgi:hypothetical protein
MKNLLPRLLTIGFLLEVLVLILSYFESQGDTTAFFQAAARLSGRVSLLYFTLLFVYATLNPSLKKEDILQYKIILTRNFAILHLIHWVLLATAVSLSEFDIVPFRLAGGALAYLLIVFAPFVLTKKVLKNTNLPIAQTVYLLYVWLIFFMTYFSRVRMQSTHVTGSMTAYYILMAFVIGLLGWYFMTIFQRKKEVA